jgi:hypothetical protein
VTEQNNDLEYRFFTHNTPKAKHVALAGVGGQFVEHSVSVLLMAVLSLDVSNALYVSWEAHSLLIAR